MTRTVLAQTMRAMGTLTLQFARKTDGTHVLTCTRSDGTATWQRRTDDFFAYHDLTHHAVETVLDLMFGFYGLLAAGWNITDFGTPWPRGPIPPEARADAALAEHVTGLLDAERATGTALEAAAFNENLIKGFEQNGAVCPRRLTDDELRCIRERFAVLAGRWYHTEPGGRLVLTWPDSKSNS